MARMSSSPNQMELAIRRSIVRIPAGKVATYGQVAAAAGYPRFHRQVAQILQKSGDKLPWHRVCGSGGEIKTKQDSGMEQRMRLTMEGVKFRGSRIDLAAHQSPLHNAPKSDLRNQNPMFKIKRTG